jgi:glycosyltransferase involved in cell wall biosynthesis
LLHPYKKSKARLGVNLIFFVHPPFLKHQSMPRFANMLAEGMKLRGHQVKIWSPAPVFHKLPGSPFIKKWLGYIDEFIIFPFYVRRRIKAVRKDTLFVFTDQALGPWVPIVKERSHVIHCHDFLALQSALGEIPEHPTRWTGRQYQRIIRNGFAKGKNFISVSENTRKILHRFLPAQPLSSEIVYNGMNQKFEPKDITVRDFISEKTGLNLKAGYLFHVGGNQWYKNRLGVVEIYDAWRNRQARALPLLLIGERPDHVLKTRIAKSKYRSDIHVIAEADDELVRAAYAGASLLLFPSKAEGFGWPIAEAMASGCPVVTTNEAPMTEVAGDAAFLIDRQPYDETKTESWAAGASSTVDHVLRLSEEERKKVVDAGLQNVKRFDTKVAIDRIEEIYRRILQTDDAK